MWASMTWIKTIPPKDWSGRLGALLQRATIPGTGDVDNILQVHSLDPGSLQAHLEIYTQAMRGSASLPKVEREMIALVVSKLNNCHY